MTTDVTISPQAQVVFGKKALHELRTIIRTQKDRLVINGKQYLFLSDWQMLAAFFGYAAYVEDVEQITEPDQKVIDGREFAFEKVIGYQARATLRDNMGKQISAGEGICMLDEKDNKGKLKTFSTQRSFCYSMAQTRACSKAMRNALSWVVKLPDERRMNDDPEIAVDATVEENPAELFD